MRALTQRDARHNERLSASILCALRGMSVILPHDRNPKTYVVMLGMACLLNLALKATDVQWVATLLSACGAFSAEMLNTAIERICDRQCQEYDEEIRDIKDIAAGGVLFWGFAFWLTNVWVVVTTPAIPGMRDRCASMLMTYLCAMLGGTTNMLFLRRARGWASNYPIDFGHVLSDGRELFGRHKTWVGLVAMTVFCGFWQSVIGASARALGMGNLGDMYVSTSPQGIMTDLAIGAAIGLTYMLCELPNSFMKRRLGVGAGGSAKEMRPMRRKLLMLVDYIDSPLGCAAVVCLHAGLGLGAYVLYAAFGTFLHLTVNVVLVMCGVRDSL